MTAAQAVSEFFSLAPKLASFAGGSPVTINVPAEKYDFTVPEVGTIEISEPGFAFTIQKKK